MFNITPGEFLIIALLALIVLGPERLPDMARSLGRLINRAREMTADLRESVDSISDDPAMKPLKDLGELATRPRQKLAEFAKEAEAEERANRAARESEQAREAAEAGSGDPDATQDDSISSPDDPAQIEHDLASETDEASGPSGGSPETATEHQPTTDDEDDR